MACIAVVGVPAEKKHKKIIYKYIDLHMPVTRKRAGGAASLTFAGFSVKRRPAYHCRRAIERRWDKQE